MLDHRHVADAAVCLFPPPPPPVVTGVIVPSWVHFGGPLLQRWYARTLLRQLRSQGLWRPGKTPVVAYCFSNGGCLPYAHVLRLLDGEQEFAVMKVPCVCVRACKACQCVHVCVDWCVWVS